MGNRKQTMLKTYEIELRHILGHRHYEELAALLGNSLDDRAVHTVAREVADWLVDVGGEATLEAVLEAAKAVIDGWPPDSGLIPGETIHLDSEDAVALFERIGNNVDTPMRCFCGCSNGSCEHLNQPCEVFYEPDDESQKGSRQMPGDDTERAFPKRKCVNGCSDPARTLLPNGSWICGICWIKLSTVCDIRDKIRTYCQMQEEAPDPERLRARLLELVRELEERHGIQEITPRGS